MTVVNPPLYLQGGTYTAALDRFGLRAPLYIPPSLVVGANTYPYDGGVLPLDTQLDPTGALQVTASGLNVSVAGGTAVITASNIGGNLPGVYIGRNQGSTSLTLATRDNLATRKDLIYIGVKDVSNGNATDELVIGAVTGTPGASNAPTTVTGVSSWIPLAVAEVPPGSGNPVIKDRRQWVSARGATRLFTTQDGMPSPPDAAGSMRYALDSGNLSYYDAVDNPGWKQLLTREKWIADQNQDFNRYKTVALQDNPQKRTRQTSYEITPGQDLNNNGVYSQIPAPLDTPTFQTPSGRVIVSITGALNNETSANGSPAGGAFMSFQIRQPGATNPIKQDFADPNACIWPFANRSTVSWTGVISGLNTDVDHIARLGFKSNDAGSWAYFGNCNIVVSPVR